MKPQIEMTCATCSHYKYFDMICRKKGCDIYVPHNIFCDDWMPSKKSIGLKLALFRSEHETTRYVNGNYRFGDE